VSGHLLELRGLVVRAGDRTIVPGVDVDVYAGRVTALCGPSGAGKTVTARVCMGVVDVEPGVVAGTLRYPARDGRDWLAGRLGGGPRAWAQLDRETTALRGPWLAYAPQAAASALNPARTIGRQLELAASRRSRPTPLVPLVLALLGEVGLDPSVVRRLPGELSGGQCQRAALAVAMASEPRVLVADEPETGLDPVVRRQVVELLVAVSRRHGAGLLLISHHADTVERIADHVIRLKVAA
jgi:ABC-type glutathione transport system ATPase component